jgi:hypothetical protein
MAISLASLNRLDTPKPPRIVLYGVHGIGKNTFASAAPKPVLINIEDGQPSGTPIDAFPRAQSFGDVMEALTALCSEDHDFETAIVDSLDWLEPMVWAETCSRNKWTDIEAPGFGKGYIAALDVWRDYFDAINFLRDEKGMAIIQTAHAQITRFDSPETEPYDRYGIKLQKRASELVQEHADMVLFANFKVNTTKTDAGFNKKVTRGVGSGQRVIYTEERAAFLAKNRHRLPPELPLDWNALAGAMVGASPVAQAA